MFYFRNTYLRIHQLPPCWRLHVLINTWCGNKNWQQKLNIATYDTPTQIVPVCCAKKIKIYAYMHTLLAAHTTPCVFTKTSSILLGHILRIINIVNNRHHHHHHHIYQGSVISTWHHTTKIFLFLLRSCTRRRVALIRFSMDVMLLLQVQYCMNRKRSLLCHIPLFLYYDHTLEKKIIYFGKCWSPAFKKLA